MQHKRLTGKKEKEVAQVLRVDARGGGGKGGQKTRRRGVTLNSIRIRREIGNDHSHRRTLVKNYKCTTGRSKMVIEGKHHQNQWSTMRRS